MEKKILKESVGENFTPTYGQMILFCHTRSLCLPSLLSLTIFLLLLSLAQCVCVCVYVYV